MGFNKPQAEEKPARANIGYVKEIGEGRVTNSGDYMFVKYDIGGYGASENIKGIFMFRPEWLVEGFNPGSLEKLDGGKAFERQYRNHVSSDESLSTLQGLCGGKEELHDELADRIFSLGIDPNIPEVVNDTEEELQARQEACNVILDAVRTCLQQFLVDEKNGERVGYTTGHQYKKTDEVDEEGKAIYVRQRWREVKSWFDPDDERAVKSLLKRASKSEGKFVISFTEDEVPF
jgi:hypothetical protein